MKLTFPNYTFIGVTVTSIIAIAVMLHHQQSPHHPTVCTEDDSETRYWLNSPDGVKGPIRGEATGTPRLAYHFWGPATYRRAGGPMFIFQATVCEAPEIGPTIPYVIVITGEDSFCIQGFASEAAQTYPGSIRSGGHLLGRNMPRVLFEFGYWIPSWTKDEEYFETMKLAVFKDPEMSFSGTLESDDEYVTYDLSNGRVFELRVDADSGELRILQHDIEIALDEGEIKTMMSLMDYGPEQQLYNRLYEWWQAAGIPGTTDENQ